MALLEVVAAKSTSLETYPELADVDAPRQQLLVGAHRGDRPVLNDDDDVSACSARAASIMQSFSTAFEPPSVQQVSPDSA